MGQKGKVRAAINAALDEAHRKEIDAAEERGRRQMLGQVIGHLQEQYMADDIDMTSDEGKAIVKVAADLMDRFGEPVDDPSEV